MTVWEFLSDRLGRLAALFALGGGLAAFLLATGAQPGVLLIALITSGLVLAVTQIVDFLKLRAHLAELEAVMDGLDQKHVFAECIPKPIGVYERRLFALSRRSGKAMMEQVSQARRAQLEYRDYVERWVHEIKTPITAARLICQNIAPETRRKLDRELGQIENHVERALFYARAESPEQDFLVRQTSLAELTDQAIGQHRSLLIQSGVRIETEGLERAVYTDGKWVVFLLGQLLQNAVRYRGEAPVIAISARDLGRQVQLTVSDNGIGVPAHELPRIFDRGFTGSNGRARGGSTGMGLYLCRKLSDRLDIGLGVKSEEGRGTSVTLTFPARQAGS